MAITAWHIRAGQTPTDPLTPYLSPKATLAPERLPSNPQHARPESRPPARSATGVTIGDF